MDQQLKVAVRAGVKNLCLLMLDLDGFKGINDTHGHKEGDRALVEAAGILKNTFREADIIARLGGDEFVVFLTDSVGTAEVEMLKKRLSDGVEAWNRAEKRRYQLAMSVGAIHHDPAVHETPEDLLRHADELMYQQKRERKRRVAQAAEAAALTVLFEPPVESVQGRN
jgi:diguanylate cyclase (GGDEF)-like protein